MKRHLLGALLAALALGPARAGDRVQTIHFPAGKSSTTLHQGLVRGEADFYAVTAREGQTADILIKSLEDNASLLIYQPPAKPVTGQDGLDIDGPVLPGGDPAPGLDEGATRHWHGALPASGTYYIVVSGDRGNATYDLTVSIR
jgi:hypothetical protein